MQRNYRFEIISVSREENFLPCSTEWDKSAYFTPSNLLPKSVVKMKHLTREQRYGISLMLQEGKERIIFIVLGFTLGFILGFTLSFGAHIIVLPFYSMKNGKCEIITLF